MTLSFIPAAPVLPSAPAALPRVHLSPPHMSGEEVDFIIDAFASNWIAPLGPHVEAFQYEFTRAVGGTPALALNSGTAALHLALLHLGVAAGDDVFVSSLTFAASVNPICYLGARPVFIDSERTSWNMDPELLAEALAAAAKKGRLPKAVVVVHLYGQSADMDPILDVCAEYNVPVIEDAAEALGATYKGRQPGTLGWAGLFSFNGNKIITTSGGGMLISKDPELLEHALKLATQARDPAPHYEHSEIGYNYRMSNLLAAVGRGQLRHLADRVSARRRNCEYYERALGSVPGITIMPEAPWGTHSRWLTVVTVDPFRFGSTCEALRLALDAHNIESRPLWKPMHLQPVFRDYDSVGGAVAEGLFECGLCLPSGSSLTIPEIDRVVDIVQRTHVGQVGERRRG